MPIKTLRVVELFAGVGGFRLGFERHSNQFRTIWANQWEPGEKAQSAFNCYITRFGQSPSHVNEDIAVVKNNVPEHDLLCGGFPCQDYSVARTGAKGIEGKKGVLWWHIRDIIENRRPPYVLLENVDRLIKSPAKQRGRDFGVILRCFADLGYNVEWRVINAADYGEAQRRRRVFIFAYLENTPLSDMLEKTITASEDYISINEWIQSDGFFSRCFSVKKIKTPLGMGNHYDISSNAYKDLVDFSAGFVANFGNAGLMTKHKVYTADVEPVKKTAKTLGSIIETDKVDEQFFLNGSLEKWEYLKGAKKIPRVKPNGEEYFYTEGGMSFPDDLNQPSRTMLTSESSLNRSTHVIEDKLTGRLRLLTPIECERLNGFPDDWTNTGMTLRKRYFMMGNALVVPLVTTMAKVIYDIAQLGFEDNKEFAS